MLATIFLENLTIHPVIGVRPRERRRRQPIEIDVAIEADLPALGRSDTLDSTIDYSGLHDRIVALAEGTKCGLLETLAYEVGQVCLADPRAISVEVTVRKPHALGHADSAGVILKQVRHA